MGIVKSFLDDLVVNQNCDQPLGYRGMLTKTV
jgi:hypothetical protein